MFCNQCEQTAKGIACTVAGVCGKKESVARLQDALVQALRLLASTMLKADARGISSVEDDDFILKSLFSTLTNVNFDEASLKGLIETAVRRRTALSRALGCTVPDDDATVARKVADLVETAPSPDKFAEDADVRSAMQILLFGLKGTAAYAAHAAVVGQRDHAYVMDFCRLLCATAQDGVERGLGDWLGLVLECGKINIRAMELLDKGNTEMFGDPEPTAVSTGHRKGHCLLVSGHDLVDLYAVLKQTEGKGVDVYTHGEMLPAHAYPKLRAFPHFVGHYGTAWQNQKKEIPAFPGAVLFTTNCIQDPGDSIGNVFTCGPVQWPGCKHIADGDFSPVVEQALAMPGFTEDEEGGSMLTGFARNTLLGAAPAVLEAAKSGALRHIFVVGGCDGVRASRGYYTEFVAKTPADTLVLTCACGKFRFLGKDFGTFGPFPRLLDCGQCNDAYSAVVVALELAKALGCGVNDLPLSIVLSWYEQKAVAILLSLLFLDVKGIRLGPTLPAFVSPNILNVLVEKFGLAPTTTPDEDIAACLAK